MNDIITVAQLSKTFHLSEEHAVPVLKNVDLTIREGEYVAVMGASGSGKSTLLYNISGMDHMSSGSVSFDGIKLEEATDRQLTELRLKRMGFVFQQSHLMKDLTIYENIVLPGYMNTERSRQAVDERAEELLSTLGITAIRDHRINEASGGQLQRVAIARALINQPSILFGDEPTGALNSSATEDVLSILRQINDQGTTILLVTHDAKVACSSTRVVFMEDGMIKDELHLGSYQDDTDQEGRMSRLTNWLQTCGF